MNAGLISRRCPAIGPDDSIGKTAELMRQSQLPLVPVLDGNRVIGVVEDRDLLKVSLNSHQHLKVVDVMRRPELVVDAELPLEVVARVMDEHGVSAAPVADPSGALKGIVTRLDLAAALTRGLRPPRIGGMATPWGIFLTTGAHRAGAGNVAVFFTGVVMALCLAVARGFLLTGLHIADGILGTDLLTAYVLDQAPRLFGFSLPWSQLLLSLHFLEGILFFLALRLLPLTGYHGGEHQVVHAIERGEDLTPESVSKMPLVHPRCGTNVAALVILLTTVAFSNIAAPLMMVLFVVVLLTWRRVGTMLQHFFTVKKPTPKQLDRAIEAGKELLRRYQSAPYSSPPLPVQIWNLGFIQVFCGATTTLWLLNLIALHYGFPRLIF